MSLVATLFVRFIAGPLCDLYGPRKVFGGLILLGAIPIGLAPLVKSANGLYVIRLFIGILGGAFVPCQVWCTGWFDKNVVGTANALAGGWGNAGGGITYFIMPAVYDSLVHHFGHSASEAWRITFVVPLICLIFCGVSLLALCEDTPTGNWYVFPILLTLFDTSSDVRPGTIVTNTLRTLLQAALVPVPTRSLLCLEALATVARSLPQAPTQTSRRNPERAMLLLLPLPH